MEEPERLKVRLTCLDIAAKMSHAAMDIYGVESRAEGYWQWLIKQDPPQTRSAAKPNTDDDIPF